MNNYWQKACLYISFKSMAMMYIGESKWRLSGSQGYLLPLIRAHKGILYPSGAFGRLKHHHLATSHEEVSMKVAPDETRSRLMR